MKQTQNSNFRAFDQTKNDCLVVDVVCCCGRDIDVLVDDDNFIELASSRKREFSSSFILVVVKLLLLIRFNMEMGEQIVIGMVQSYCTGFFNLIVVARNKINGSHTKQMPVKYKLDTSNS